MPDKHEIIANVEKYTASELVDYIESGIITLEEIEFSVSEDVYREVYDKLNRLFDGPDTVPPGEKTRPMQWYEVDQNNIESLKRFVRENPHDSQCDEARRLINALRREAMIGLGAQALISRINEIGTNEKDSNSKDAAIVSEIIERLSKKRVTREQFLGIIRNDKNLLSSYVLTSLVEKGVIMYSELEHLGIDRRFIEHLANKVPRQTFKMPQKLSEIGKLSTEVYFWGIPSSGKSCALGAIMSVANNGLVASMAKNPTCQGYDYMTRLSTLFKEDGKVGTLPEGTSIYSTYEMGFDLTDGNGAVHPITCIDLAGELVRCMYKRNANETLDKDEAESLNTLTDILVDNRTGNRKIHIFVIEYGGEARLYEGLSQPEYLDAALDYIERTKIFDTETDAIYIMLTKVDKTGKVGQPLVKELKSYIISKYKGFYDRLQRICIDREINGGEVECIPFSLGQVCFQDYCLFNEAPAANMVRKLIIRAKGFKKGKLRAILKK